MTARFGRRFVSAPALLLVMASLVMLMPGGPRVSRAAQEASVQGDVTCDSSVNAVDSLQILRDVAGLGTTAGCLADAGDVNCDDAVNSVDSLRILRYVAGLTNTTPDGCVAIGEPLELPPTSEALIAAALAGGDITPEESLLYRAYALYDDPRLPDEFRSPVPDMHAGLELFLEVAQNESQLSQGLLDQLAPFSARPADPISIFNNPPNGVSAVAPVAWKSLLAAGGAARVWLPDGPGADYQLTTNAAAVTKVWNALPGIFRYGIPDTPGAPNINPDGAIDIYFVDVGSIDPRLAGCDAVPTPTRCVFAANGQTGAAAPNIGGTWSAYVLISTARQGDALINTLAHELGHVGQFAYDAYEPMWLLDSTATWTAFRVVQKVSASQTYTYERLPAFFKGLHKPLTRDTEDDLNRYGSWLFFYFASMEKGDGIVTQIWEAAAAAGVQGERAVDQKLPFDDYFDDFTVRNWNQKPPLKTAYKDKDSTFPAESPKAMKTIFVLPDEAPLEIDLDPLSAHYERFTFDTSLRTIVFDNKLSGVEHIHVWGIVKVGDTWKEPEDWSDLPKKEWCRDDPEEDITELVIIVSNSDMTTTIFPPEDAVVEAKAAGCSGWQGTATSTWWWDSLGTGIATATFEGSWEAVDDRGELEIIGCEWEDDPCLPFYPTGNISWSWKSDIPGDPGCHESVTGHLAATALPEPFNLNQIFVLQPDGQGQYRYWGSGYFEIPDREDDGTHCENTVMTGGISPYNFFGVDEYASSENPPGSNGGTCGIQDWQISADATTIKGSCYAWNYSYHYLLYEWEFHRYGEPH